MAQQINLYDPALLRKRDWFALSSLVLGAGVAAVLVAAVGVLVRTDLPALQAQVMDGEARLKAVREQLQALTPQGTERKPDPRIERELAVARQLSTVRSEVLQALRLHLASGDTPLADYLRALARQSMAGLWITGFTWDATSDGVEIRGRTTDPALLPEYIARLNRESVFRGRAFAALTIAEGKPDTATGTTTPSAAPSTTPPVAPSAATSAAPSGSPLALASLLSKQSAASSAIPLGSLLSPASAASSAAPSTAPSTTSSAAPSVAPVTSSQKARFHEFTLVPVKRAEVTQAAAGKQEEASHE